MSGSFSNRWSQKIRSNPSANAENKTANPSSSSVQTLSGLSSRSTATVQVVTPVHFQEGYQYPLIVWLHSAGNNEREIEQVLPHISTRNYLAVGIRATKATDVRGRCFDWSQGRTGLAKACHHVFEAIDLMTARFSIHPERIILAGLGSGATMACSVAMQAPDRFAGVVRMAGRFPNCQQTNGGGPSADNQQSTGGTMGNLNALRERQMPMLWQQAINGVDDDPDCLQREIADAQWMRAQVEIRQYRGDDVVNTVALRDIDRWCFDTIISPKPSQESVSPHLIRGADLRMVDFSAN